MASEIEKAPASIRREVVAGSPFGSIGGVGGALMGWSADDVVRAFGDRVYEYMGCDPACATAMAVLIAGSIGEGPQLTPAVKAAPGEIVSQRKKKSQVKLSEEICEFNKRGLARLDRPVEESLEDWSYDGLTHGASVMEQTYDFVDDETGKGKLMLRTLAVKPRRTWSFRVDAAMRVAKLRCLTIGNGNQDVEREKFGIFTFGMRYRDPRGTSVYRPAYNAWNRKVQQYVDFDSYLKHFADPSLILEADNTWSDRPDPATGAMLTVGQQLVAIGRAFKNQAVLGLPAGAKATLIESKGKGEAYHGAFDREDLDIFRSVLLGSRPVVEAQHGSKADSESGMDLVSIAIGRVRKPLGRAFRDDIVYWQTRLNYGKEVADQLTPNVHFGVADHDVPDLLVAYVKAYVGGLLKEGTLPYVYDKFGWPAPAEGFKTQAEIDAEKAANAPPDANADPNADPKAKGEPKADPNANGGGA